MNPVIPTQNTYLARQPILDRARRVVGFELLFRNDPGAAAVINNHVAATASVVAQIFSELGLGHALGGLKAFINFNEEFLLDDALELMPPQQVVLEILPGARASVAVAARCRQLRALGFQLALDNVASMDDTRLSLVEHMSIVKVDLARRRPSRWSAWWRPCASATSACSPRSSRAIRT